MGEIRALIRDYMSPCNQNIFFKALNIIDIYNLNAIFRQPRTTPNIPVNSLPEARDDNNAVVIGDKTEVFGNVIGNDLNGTVVTFNQLTGKYGYLTELGSIYTYTLYSSTDNSSLPDSGVDTDSFSYIFLMSQA